MTDEEVGTDNPDVVTRILAIMAEARAEPELFPLPGDRG